MPGRVPISDITAANVFIKSRRRCCFCYYFDNDLTQKEGQLAHVDRDHSNSVEENLAYLCLSHHDQYDTRRRQTRNLTELELLNARRLLYQRIGRDGDCRVLVEIVLDENFAAFDEIAEERVLRRVRDALRMGAEVRVVGRIGGSVRLKLEMHSGDLAAFLNALSAGTLDDLLVTNLWVESIIDPPVNERMHVRAHAKDPIMNLIDQLVKLLKAGSSPESPEIVALLAAITAHQPELEATARSIVENWPAAKPSLLSSFSWGQIGAVGGGVGIAALLPFLAQYLLPIVQSKVLLPAVTDPLILLPIIAVLGALAGAAYSIYCNHGFVAPTFEKKAGVLTLGRAGILNEISAGAVAAVTTVWLAAAGLATPGNVSPDSTPPAAVATADASDKKNTERADAASAKKAGDAKTTDGKKNLLNWSIMISAVTSGWFGARMRSSKLDQSLLQTALAETAARPAAPEGLANLIREAPNAAMAAHLATGKDVAGVHPSVLEGGPASALWDLLDEARVRSAAATTKLTGDGKLLNLGMLKSLDSVDPLVREIIADFNLSDVAALTKEAFLTRANQAGVKSAELEKLLEIIRSKAVQVMEILKQLPPGWSWPA